jgi:hypothetical protein
VLKLPSNYYWKKNDRRKGRSDGKTRKKTYENREKRYCWNLKEETLDCALWISGFGRGGGPVKRQTTK